MALPLLPLALGAIAIFMLTRKGSEEPRREQGGGGGGEASQDPCIDILEMPMPAGATDAAALKTAGEKDLASQQASVIYDEFMAFTQDDPRWKAASPNERTLILNKAKRLSTQLRCNGYYDAQKSLDAKIVSMQSWS